MLHALVKMPDHADELLTTIQLCQTIVQRLWRLVVSKTGQIDTFKSADLELSGCMLDNCPFTCTGAQ